MTINQLQARWIIPLYESSMSIRVNMVLTTIAITFPQFDFLVVSSPSRKTPRVAPPVSEKILKANQRIFFTGSHANAIKAKIKPKIITAIRETNK